LAILRTRLFMIKVDFEWFFYWIYGLSYKALR
jgi:hypothetical protein